MRPKVEWPDGKKICATFTVAFEAFTRGGHFKKAKGLEVNLVSLSHANYGGNAGIWRILEILERNKARSTVDVNGLAVKACTMFAVQANGAEVVTIEGLAKDGVLHPMQQAFHEHHGLQCGFCTPGMIMSAIDMVRRLGPKLDEATIRHELEGNICRCTGYHNIVRAIAAGAAAMA